MNIITLKCKPCENNIPHENCCKVKQRTRKQHILDEAKVKEKGLKRKQIKFNCNECNYEGKFQQNLLSHIDAIHKNIVRFQCNICDYKAHQKHAISEHFWRNHNNGKKLDILTLSCEQCEKNIPHENCCKIKQRNRKQKLIGESLKCEINDCIFSTNFRQSLAKHIQNKHRKLTRYTCNICDFKSYHDNHVKSHQVTNHKDQDVKVIAIDCELCQQNIKHLKHDFSKKSQSLNKGETTILEKLKSLKQHPVKHEEKHGDENKLTKNFNCEMDGCSFSASRRKKLDQHTESIHLNILRYYCNICEYKSYFNYRVGKHQEEHNNAELKVLKIGCYECEMNIDHKSHYKVVDKRCKEEGCSFSTNSVRHKTVLKYHYERLHLQILRYGCSLCDVKKFYQSSIRKHQKLSHIGDDDLQVIKIGKELSNNYVTKDEFTDLKKEPNLEKEFESMHSGTQQLEEYFEKDEKKYFKENIKDESNDNCENCQDKIPHEKCLIIEKGKGKLNCNEKCTHCQENIPHKRHFNAHRKGKTSAKAKGNLKCSTEGCNFSTNLRQTLMAHHEKIHLQILKFSCNLCDYKSYHEAHVKSHQNYNHPDTKSLQILRIGCTFCEQNISHVTHSNARKGHNKTGTFKCKEEGCDA